MKIYISGPITGLPKKNRPAFAVAWRMIIDAGHEPINPHDVCYGMPADSPWIDFMRADIKAMMDADAVLALPGWENSPGAKIEVELAKKLRLKVFTLEEIQGIIERKK